MIVKRDRVLQDVEDMESKNNRLRKRVDMPENEKKSASNEVQTLRDQMREMREKMIQLERNTIDIGRNPGKALEQISNPLLDLMQEEVNGRHQPNLEENMNTKSKLEKEETDLNSQIYDYQISQVNLKQVLIDQRFCLDDMGQELENMKQMVIAKRERKQIL